jgi:hypothetical protein
LASQSRSVRNAVFVEVVEPVGRIACPACTCGAGTGERSRRVGISDDGCGGQGTSVDGAAVRPAKRSEGGIAYGVVAVGEGLAAAVVGPGQAVELIPFALLQGGCALVSVGDDAGGGVV